MGQPRCHPKLWAATLRAQGQDHPRTRHWPVVADHEVVDQARHDRTQAATSPSSCDTSHTTQDGSKPPLGSIWHGLRACGYWQPVLSMYFTLDWRFYWCPMTYPKCNHGIHGIQGPQHPARDHHLEMGGQWSQTPWAHHPQLFPCATGRNVTPLATTLDANNHQVPRFLHHLLGPYGS